MFKLAGRNGIEIPYASVEEARRAVLVREQDFYDLAYAYLRAAAAQNVRHAEIRVPDRPRGSLSGEPGARRGASREEDTPDRLPALECEVRVFDRLEAHNLKALLDARLYATVNSDDPAYFGGYIEDNYLAVQEALGLGRNDLCRLARNALEARFLAPDEKEKLIGELDDYAGRGWTAIDPRFWVASRPQVSPHRRRPVSSTARSRAGG